MLHSNELPVCHLFYCLIPRICTVYRPSTVYGLQTVQIPAINRKAISEVYQTARLLISTNPSDRAVGVKHRKAVHIYLKYASIKVNVVSKVHRIQPFSCQRQDTVQTEGSVTAGNVYHSSICTNIICHKSPAISKEEVRSVHRCSSSHDTSGPSSRRSLTASLTSKCTLLIR